MKKSHLLLPAPAVLGLATAECRTSQPAAATATTKGYTYETVPNDPLGARVYHLVNELTVYLSNYKNMPRVQTCLAVRAGSKNDPAAATGAAHHLEHRGFKGPSRLGARHGSRQKPELAKIKALHKVRCRRFLPIDFIDF